MSLWAKKPPVAPRLNAPIYQIAADDDALYAVSSAGLGEPSILWCLPHGQSIPQELTRASDLGSITPYREHIYFTSGGRVMRVAKRGGTAEQLAQHSQPFSFAVRDDTSLYLSVSDTRRAYSGGAPPVHPGAILRMPLSGGPLVELVEHRSGIPSLAVDEARVYLATDDGIASVDKNGGALRALIASGDPNERPYKLASGGAFLYAPVRGELREIDKQTGKAKILYRASILLDVAAHDGWIYVVRNTAFLGPGKPPEPGGLLAISQLNHEVRTIAEPLAGPQQVAAGGNKIFVLENALTNEPKGLALVKSFSTLPQAAAGTPMATAKSAPYGEPRRHGPRQSIHQDRAVAIARQHVSMVPIPAGTEVIVSRDGDNYVVTFKMSLPEGTHGPDYYAQVHIDIWSGKVVKTLVAP